MKEIIKDWTGKQIGYIDDDSNGNKVGHYWNGKILGFYKTKIDTTTDFYGRQFGKGNQLIALIYKEEIEQQMKKKVKKESFIKRKKKQVKEQVKV